MKILIIEDEARIAKRIERMVLSILDQNKPTIQICDNLIDGKSFIKKNEIDLLFLDLNLNGEDGFNVLKGIISEKFHTVIISAYKDKAITAFEYGVLDFIPKPFSEERIVDAFARIKEKNEGTSFRKYLSVNKKGSKQLIKASDILYIKGADVYAEIHTIDSAVYLHNMSLDSLSDILPSYFERIHRSHIVNMNFAISTLSEPGSRYFLKLKNDEVLPFGRTKYKIVQSKWLL